MSQTVLQRVISGETLTRLEMDQWLSNVVSGRESEPVIAAVLSTLAFRGESVSELSGALDALKRVMVPFPSNQLLPLLDTCGTGGDGMGTFNISTTVAIVLAAGGIPVVKHGGRAVSSRSGSADVLEALGIRVDLPVERSLEIFSELGIVFFMGTSLPPCFKGSGTASAIPSNQDSFEHDRSSCQSCWRDEANTGCFLRENGISYGTASDGTRVERVYRYFWSGS